MPQSSSSFELLDSRVRRWIWRQGWSSLKDIQESAIPVVIDGNKDVIISASTAGGKTEAAFLPIISSILRLQDTEGYQVLYISPLKALINDQFRRLLDMTTDVGITVTPWHGDISPRIKNQSLRNPNGIIIITPESLESFLINKKQFLKTAFSSLKYIVIDELHSFIGTERGKQLQSLLSRIEFVIDRKVPRIAMSATFSDYESVKFFLRNDESMQCAISSQGKRNHDTKVLIKEFINTKDNNVDIAISKEIYTQLRGSNNLVFTNSRITAEKYAIILSDLSIKSGVPNEFRIHHGYISKENRKSVERELQSGNFPVTAICTSTLELGIDIGKVKSIAQIGAANSISGLRQRLGRSGRRNEPSILRIFSIDNGDNSLLSVLKPTLLQNIAIIELMCEHRYEKPSVNYYHFSTLIQQILAVIAQYDGFYAKDGWSMLCKNGAFKNVTPELFLELLKELGMRNVLSQLNTGQIVIGYLGEKILGAKDFYVTFNSSTDFIVINQIDSKSIGMVQECPKIGDIIILNGQRWIVNIFDKSSGNIYVSPVYDGGDIIFDLDDGIEVDRIIAQKIREIYESNIMYPYLDVKSGTPQHLIQSRSFYHEKKLNKQPFLNYRNKTYLFTWAGTKVNKTICLLAQYFLKKPCTSNALFITNLTRNDINILNKTTKIDGIVLASLIPNGSKLFQKYDYLLPNKLLNLEYSSTYLDVEAAYDLIQNICSKKEFQSPKN